jgi:hypothetical protein
MTLEQNKQVVLGSFRILEIGDPAAADRTIAPDFINREADDDPDRPDRGLRGRRPLLPPVVGCPGLFLGLSFDRPEVIAEDEWVVVMAT